MGSKKSVIQKVSPNLVIVKKKYAPNMTMPQFTNKLALEMTKKTVGEIKIKNFGKKQKRFMYGL